MVETTKAQTVLTVSRKELPLCCPDAKEAAAPLHPRVFLPIEKTGEVTCPYCGKHYKLVD